jgi:hypothetical protein
MRICASPASTFKLPTENVTLHLTIIQNGESVQQAGGRRATYPQISCASLFTEIGRYLSNGTKTGRIILIWKLNRFSGRAALTREISYVNK